MKARLSVLYFLQFAVWGCYLSCLGQLLGAGGLGRDIQWFYAAVGIVSLFTPALAGHLADRFIPAPRLLALCHFCAACAMTGAWVYASSHPTMEFAPFFALYLCFLAFYMPTMALSNTASFAIMRSHGVRPVDCFPTIRIWGTIGFVAAMWLVNSIYYFDGTIGFTLSDTHPAAAFRFQYTPMQLFASAIFGLITSVYALSLPSIASHPAKATDEKRSLKDIFGLRAFTMFRIPEVRTFLIFAIFTGVCLQISNGFATPFINHFMGIEEYARTFIASNSTLLVSLSQICEAVFVLTVGVAINKIGFKWVIFTALIAWCLRFLFLGTGNPGSGIAWLVLSMIVYGIAFNFFNIAGHLYMESVCTKEHKGFGQGLLMMVSNGIGATVGMIGAGSVVNHYCQWQQVNVMASGAPMRLFMGDWTSVWFIFATYAFVIGVAFAVFFRTNHRSARKSATSRFVSASKALATADSGCKCR